jgi:RHS repeat-associated protein
VLLAYTYDPAGNVRTLTDTIDGHADATSTYTPDVLNRLAEITQSGPGTHDKRVDITYNEVSLPATVDRFADLGGTQEVAGTRYTFDGLNRLTGVSDSHGSTPIASYQYTFDSANRITQVISNDGTTDYTYDNGGQLLTADHHAAANPAESYTYDPGGNRTTSGTQASSYQIGPDNRLNSDGTFTYTYDNEGNLVQRTEIATSKVRVFQWDERNRLTAVIDKDAAGNVIQQVLFTYDALNQRIAKEVKQGATDVATYFVSERDNPLLQFVHDDGPAGPHPAVLVERYLTGNALDQVFAQEDASGKVSWLLRDDLGTVRDVVDNSGTGVDHITYDAFGNVITQTSAALVPAFLFAGRALDAETGLYYDRARYYDPKLGRFLSEDPLGFLAGTNLYRYVHNSPTTTIDPLGTQDDNPDGLSVPGDDAPPEGPMCTPDNPDSGPKNNPAQPVPPTTDQPNSQAQNAQAAAAATIPTIIYQATIESLDDLDNSVKTVVDAAARFTGSDVISGEAVPPADRSLADALRSTVAIGEDAASNVIGAIESQAATVVETVESEAPTVVEAIQSEAATVAEVAEADALAVVEAVESDAPAVLQSIESGVATIVQGIGAVIFFVGLFLGG